MYSVENVARICAHGAPRDANLGSGENSVDAQHRCAVDFWEKALSLTGPAKLQPSDADYARSEIARHQAALNRLPDFSVRGRLQRARDHNESLEAIAQVIGSANGGSVQSAIQERINFWQAALECEDAPGKPTLTPNMRVFAEAELARQRAALAAMMPRMRNRYGPPPDFKGQPV